MAAAEAENAMEAAEAENPMEDVEAAEAENAIEGAESEMGKSPATEIEEEKAEVEEEVLLKAAAAVESTSGFNSCSRSSSPTRPRSCKTFAKKRS